MIFSESPFKTAERAYLLKEGTTLYGEKGTAYTVLCNDGQWFCHYLRSGCAFDICAL